MTGRRGPRPERPGRVERTANTARLVAMAPLERATPFLPAAALARLRDRRVRAVVRHAYATVPFYRAAMDARGLSPGDIAGAGDLPRLPLIDGPALAADPDAFVSRPFAGSGHRAFFTSGSTSAVRRRVTWDHTGLLLRTARGERDRVVITRLAGERWATAMLREARARGRGEQPGHARLMILPRDASAFSLRGALAERTLIPDAPDHYHRFPASEPLHLAAAHMDALRPRVVFSFGSYADQFLRFVADSGERIALPRLWVYFSDALSAEGRELGERRFGVRLVSTYAAVEFGTIGFQCERGEGYHLNDDLCPIRVIDEDGADVPPGESGEIVVSGLENRATVLLNYRLGDRGALATEPCRCGRSLPLLARVEGRSSEAVSLADGRIASPALIEGLFIRELRRTVQDQIERRGPGRLHWRMVPVRDADHQELRAAVIDRAREVFGPAVEVSVEFVDAIPRTPAGKIVRIISGPA